MPVATSAWCPVCCTRHERVRRCPGELPATEAERHGFRADVQTPWGVESYGVLIARADDLWRARILTYPNVLWLVPSGAGSIKFVGHSARDVEEQAVEFIRAHCRRRGFKVLASTARIVPGRIVEEIAPGAVAGHGAAAPAPRKVRFLPLRFGVVTPSELGGTGNLSESGLFVITSTPLDEGRDVQMLLNIQPKIVSLEGEVIWMRSEHHAGRSPGMGVRLVQPSPRYLDYVRELD